MSETSARTVEASAYRVSPATVKAGRPYLPLNGAEIVIRKPKVEEADVPAGEAA